MLDFVKWFSYIYLCDRVMFGFQSVEAMAYIDFFFLLFFYL